MTNQDPLSISNTLGRGPGGDQQADGEKPRDLFLHIAADGTWYYRGTAIERPGLVKLFASVLRRDEEGRYWLVTPVERGIVTVEDAPFVAVDCDAEGEGREQVLHFRTNLDHEIVAGAEHPLRLTEVGAAEERRPYLLVRPGLEALVSRPLFYRLAEMAVPSQTDPNLLGVWSQGVFFPLGQAQ
ncbi:MAG: DUF1285 domain-containing protein [Pseudomonadota bacterium]